MLERALSTVRDTLCTSEAGFAHPASSHQFCILTTPDRIHEISPATPRPSAVARACPGPPLESSTRFSDAPADHSPEVLAVASNIDPFLALSERSRSLVRGTITLDDAHFTTKIAIHSGAGVLAPFGCMALLATGSSQIFIRKMFRIACSRFSRHPSRASRNTPPVLGGGLSNRLL